MRKTHAEKWPSFETSASVRVHEFAAHANSAFALDTHLFCNLDNLPLFEYLRALPDRQHTLSINEHKSASGLLAASRLTCAPLCERRDESHFYEFVVRLVQRHADAADGSALDGALGRHVLCAAGGRCHRADCCRRFRCCLAFGGVCFCRYCACRRGRPVFVLTLLPLTRRFLKLFLIVNFIVGLYAVLIYRLYLFTRTSELSNSHDKKSRYWFILKFRYLYNILTSKFGYSYDFCSPKS